MAYGQGSASVGSESNYVDSGVTPGSGATLLREGSDFYKSSFADIASYQRRDVTEQIQRYHQLYGGSDNTQQGGLAASKSLNYAKAPTMQQALRVRVTSIPFTFTFTGQVGLFGAENAYIAIDLDIQNTQNLRDGVVVNTYVAADINYVSDNNSTVNDYEPAELDENVDPPPPDPIEEGTCIDYEYRPNEFTILNRQNCYMAAKITDIIPRLNDPKVSVDLNNKGTGNIYIDNWLETMLYKRTQEMWGYDRMYVDPRYTMYVGFHARNTRHLPYNVEVTIGQEFLDSGEIKEKDLIATSTLAY
jgi:hypothetical protein